jgi:hypothetical protein
MADHSRTQIRQAIAGILKQETDPSGWALVHQSRVDYSRNVWPYLKVYTDRDDSARISLHSPHVQERSLSVVVVGLVRVPAGETETVEDKMDHLAKLIESNLTDEAVHEALPLVKSLDLISSQMDLIMTTEEAISHAELTMIYKCRYMTLEGMPEDLI